MSHVRVGLLSAITFYFLLSTASAQEFTSTDFKVLNPVLHPGYFSSSDDFRLFGAVGQPAAGQSSSGDATINTLKAGFLYFAAPSPTPSPSPSPAPSPSPPSSSGGPILDIFKGIIGVIDKIKDVIYPCAPADLNCDGRVDIYDAGIMFYWWGKTLTQPEYVVALGNILAMGRSTPDINRDHYVDIFDLSIMLSKWTRS
ncbi:MAG: hypothetical protein Q7J73_03050 [Dehalococcoidales bacterium]|nr:hypothetical protein [Dehalococcoidales bacterium]